MMGCMFQTAWPSRASLTARFNGEGFDPSPQPIISMLGGGAVWIISSNTDALVLALLSGASDTDVATTCLVISQFEKGGCFMWESQPPHHCGLFGAC